MSPTGQESPIGSRLANDGGNIGLEMSFGATVSRCHIMRNDFELVFRAAYGLERGRIAFIAATAWPAQAR